MEGPKWTFFGMHQLATEKKYENIGTQGMQELFFVNWKSWR